MALCTANFETGLQGNTISVSDAGSATAWDQVNIANGTLTYDNQHVHSGTVAAKFAPTGDFQRLRWVASFGTPTDHYGRIYIYINGFPSGVVADLVYDSLAPWEIFVLNTGVLRLTDNSGSVDGAVSVGINQWVRIEWHVLHSTTVGVLEAKLFNDPESAVPSETIGGTADRNTGVNGTMIEFATFSPWSGRELWLDDIVAGATSYPGPMQQPQSSVLMARHGIGMGRW